MGVEARLAPPVLSFLERGAIEGGGDGGRGGLPELPVNYPSLFTPSAETDDSASSGGEGGDGGYWQVAAMLITKVMVSMNVRIEISR